MLPRFDFARILEPSFQYSNIAIVGPQKTGKSFNVIRLVSFMIARGLVLPSEIILFKNSDSERNYDERLFPHQLQWSARVLGRYLELRNRAILENPNIAPGMIILDDVTENITEIQHSRAIKRLVLSGRHLKLMRIYSYHDFAMIAKGLRSSIEMYLFTRIDSKDLVDWIKQYELSPRFKEVLTIILDRYQTNIREQDYHTVVYDRDESAMEKRWYVI